MSKPRFVLPSVVENSSGWGPTGAATRFEDVPFAPFSKTDRLGKVSDWSSNFKSNRFTQQFGSSATAFNYRAEEDENSFSLVDSKPKKQQKGYRRFTRGRGGRWQNNQGGRQSRNAQNRRYQNNRRNFHRKPWQQQTEREPSIALPDSLEPFAVLTFDELSRETATATPSDLEFVGKLAAYKPKMDQITPNNTKNLVTFRGKVFSATTSEDPIISKYIKSKAANVYGTDVLLSFLMTAPRAAQSFDILVHKRGTQIVFDKRRESRIDYLTVNENWNEVPSTDKDSINHISKLEAEATKINHSYSQQVLDSDKPALDYKTPNPFAQDPKAASSAYRYRKWTLDDENKTTVVARCELNAHLPRKNRDGNNLIVVRALNEFDPKVTGNNIQWRQKLGSQAVAVLATEMKNNRAKLSRWSTQALLSGADQLRFGYVSRVYSKDNSRHVILRAEKHVPRVFAQQMNLSDENLWGVLKRIVSEIDKQPDGMFLILKDPNEAQLKLFSVTANDLTQPAPQHE